MITGALSHVSHSGTFKSVKNTGLRRAEIGEADKPLPKYGLDKGLRVFEITSDVTGGK